MTIVKACEFSERKKVAIKYMLFTGLSNAEIGKQIGFSKLTAPKVIKKLELAVSVEKK